jgi:hypothetical protein
VEIPHAYLRFDRCLVHEHDGDIVFHRIDTVALLALQALGILPVFERLLAGGANQNLQQLLGDHAEHCTPPVTLRAQRSPV